jgi:hypothetical protein
MQESEILHEIDREIECLLQARDLIASMGDADVKQHRLPGKPRAAKSKGKRGLSAAGRRKISVAQKARWAEKKKRASAK